MSTVTVAERQVPRPPLALAWLSGVALLKLVVHLAAISHYGYFRDELYYLASTSHLDWGYVDHPPLSIALLAAVRAVFGDSLPALRAVPVLSGMATVIVVGIIARELGGARFAQVLAAAAALTAPVFLGLGGFYSMNALDLLFWALAIWVALRAIAGGAARDWLLLGGIAGLGLLNKISMLWCLGGLALGLLLTAHRRVLTGRWPWLAVAFAVLLFAPHLVWQVQQGWPTLEFMHNAASKKMAGISPPAFLADQLFVLNFGSAPIWLAGLGYGLFSSADSRGRVLAWLYLGVLAVLLVAGSARASYLAPACCGLFALGAVALERVTAGRFRRSARTVIAGLLVLGGAGSAPLALPLLPVESYVRYQAAIGIAPRTEERHRMGALPQHFADMFGWEEMVALVATAHQRLTPEEQARCRVFGQNYGEAGAVDVLGRRLGLPRALSGHNSYWLWGPGDAKCDVLIIIGGDREDNAEYFEDIEIVGQTGSPWSMPYERDLDVSIGRRPKLDLRQAWPRLKHFN